MKPRRTTPEDALQIQIFQALHWMIPRSPLGPVFFHVPNGGHRTKTEAGIFKAMGVVPGVSDVIGLYDGRAFAIELKAPGRPAVPTEHQKDFQERWITAGGLATTVNSAEGFFAFLDVHGVPVRGRVGA